MAWKREACAGLVILVLLTAALPACRVPEGAMPATVPPATPHSAPPPTAAKPAVAPAVVEIAPTAIDQGEPAAAIASPEAIWSGPLSPPCSVLLSPLPPQETAAPIRLVASDAAIAQLRQQAPAAAWPALQRMLDAPVTVGLVAFQVGREAEGVYLNADVPMPLASVAKLIVLVAYAEAIGAGELNPMEPVSLAELDRYYLPNFDLGAHRRAVAELGELGRIASPDDDPTVALDDVAWMMVRHSSNAAADYLQLRLGQRRIQETAVDLGLNDPPHSQSAPCTFLGQFLMMGNHLRDPAVDLSYLSGFTGQGAEAMEAYGREVALLADAYINEDEFREAERAWRSATRGPALAVQRYFTGSLAPRGTAGAYASLMSRLARNGLSNADSSYQARRLLEWPNVFETNQEFFSNVGYKNGSLPGALTTAYYAYRWDDAAPVIVVLFYRDLPQPTYRLWRNQLPHDELARWLLADPAAIPALSAFVNGARGP